MADDECAPAPIDPTTFDVIVLGTGLPESIIAAAASKSSLKVLHLDSDDFYGSNWGSVTLEQVEKASLGRVEKPYDAAEELEQLGLLQVHPGAPPTASPVEFHKYDDAVGSSRSYSLDLAGPKLALSAGPLIDTLLKSGASNYLEFKSIEASYIWRGSRFACAPTSRSELFTDSSLDMREKNRLWRFLKSLREFTEDDLQATFVELLNKHQLSPAVQSLILYAVALLDDDEETSSTPLSAKEGIQILEIQQASIGRFANAEGAFLYPLYGQGELCQSFCRSAAVGGALYVLRRPVVSILVSKETAEYRGIRTIYGQSLYSEKLVVGSAFKYLVDNVEGAKSTPSNKKLARLICITDSSLHPQKTNILLIFPPNSVKQTGNSVIRVLQLGSNTSVCPNKRFVIEASTLCDSADSARKVMQAVQDILLNQLGADDGPGVFHQDCPKPKLLWSAFYLDEAASSSESQLIGNRIAVCCPPGASLDYRKVMATTEETYKKLFGVEEWF